MPAGEFSGGVDSHRMGKSNRLVVVIALVVFLGIGLRVVQYVANTSLWLDEIALVMGILDSDLVALLTQPLPFDQVAPKGFLLIEKLSVLAFGSSDYVLRLLPFLSSIVGLGAFWRLSTLMLPGTGALVAMLLFATAAPLIAFSGQAKQYSTDVCAALLLTLLAHHLISQKPTTRGTWLSAVGGTALLWLSQPAVLVAAGLTVPIALWMRADSQRARLRRIAIVTGAWGLSAAMVTGVGLASMSPSTRDYMHVFWADGFPDSLTEVVRARWAWNNIRLLFGSPPAGLAYPWPAFYATMAAMGLVVLWVQQRRVAVLLLGPMLAALGAAVAGQYPFSDRLILFLTPSMILAIGALIASGHRLVGRYSKPVAAVIALGLTAPALYPVVRRPPPYRIEHAKPVLAHLQENREATDAIYVYYGAAPVVGRYDASFGLSRAAIRCGWLPSRRQLPLSRGARQFQRSPSSLARPHAFVTDLPRARGHSGVSRCNRHPEGAPDRRISRRWTTSNTGGGLSLRPERDVEARERQSQDVRAYRSGFREFARRLRERSSRHDSIRLRVHRTARHSLHQTAAGKCSSTRW